MKKKSDINRLSSEEKEAIKQADEVVEITKMPGWTRIVNFIQLSVQWPNPKLYENIEDVLIPYTQSYGASELAKKLGQFISDQEEILNKLNKKMEEDVVSPYSLTE